MTGSEGELEVSPQRTPGWQLFIIGVLAALIGNLVGWVLSLVLLVILLSDAAVEAFAWLTVLLSWSLAPLVCLVYGLLAAWLGPKVARRRPIRLRRSIILAGFMLGVAFWLILGGIVGGMVTFMP